MAKAMAGDQRGAVADFSRAIGIDPELVQAYFNRGVAYAALEDFDRAIADYSAALRRSPAYAEAHYARGLAYINLHRMADGCADLTRAKALGYKPAEQMLAIYCGG